MIGFLTVGELGVFGAKAFGGGGRESRKGRKGRKGLKAWRMMRLRGWWGSGGLLWNGEGGRGKGFTRRRGGAEGESGVKVEVGFGVEDF